MALSKHGANSLNRNEVESDRCVGNVDVSAEHARDSYPTASGTLTLSSNALPSTSMLSSIRPGLQCSDAYDFEVEIS